MTTTAMTLSQDLTKRMRRTARALRQTRAGMADEPAAARTAFLQDILDQAIADLGEDERTDFLVALQDEFPCEMPAGRAAAPVAAAEAEPPAEESFADLEARFMAAAKGLPEDERSGLLDRLQEAGLGPEPSTSDSDSDAGPMSHMSGAGINPRSQAAMQAVMRKLKIERMDLTRAMKLLLLLLEAEGRTDKLMWSTWRTISPRSSFRRPSDLRAELVKYVSGDREVSGSRIKQHHDLLQKLSACLIAGMGKAGLNFARNHLRKFSPEEIMAATAQEGGLFGSQEAKCWNHFLSIAPELREDSVDFGIREAVAKYTENLLDR